MQKRNAISTISIVLCMMLILSIPWKYCGNSDAINVDDGTLEDWVNAKLTLYDDMFDVPPGNDMTDLTLVSFDYDDIWLYVRWDIYDNLSYKSGILYDMGINLSGTGNVWDIYVSAELDLVGGNPHIVNISIRDTSDAHIWNASDDGNLTHDGSLYLDPTPGLSPGNLSVEARFPLANIGVATGVVFGQFRSHSSPSVNSAVKDKVPDTGYIILIIDNNPPQLSNATATPNPQENGNPVKITVNATDDYCIGSVWVNITRPDGSWINVSMSNGSIGEWFFEDVYDIPGLYFYTVFTNDTANNWIALGPQNFTIIDTDGPNLVNIQASPDPQENNNDVTIAVNVTDDVGVNSVWINIIYPNGSSINVTMTKGPSDTWLYTEAFDQLGNHSYTIWTDDTSGNWNTSGPSTFLIHDTDGPNIDNLQASPNPQENNEDVTIAVNVTDDVGVDSVWISITYPNGSSINVTMTKGPSDMWLYTEAFDQLGIHSYTIWANDTSGNWNTAVPSTILIQDTDSPEFHNLVDSPDPQENGYFVNVSLDVTDDIAVDSVWINITYPDLRHVNASMEKGPLSQWFYTMPYDDLGDYSYTIWAMDTSGNLAVTAPGTFKIHDTDPPEISSVSDLPDPQAMNGNVNISAIVMDDVSVVMVSIEIRYPDGVWLNYSMVPGANDKWFLSSTFSELGSYAYSITAVDFSGNTNSTALDAFEIVDIQSPHIGPPLATPNPQEPGKDINITVVVEDDVGVSWVIINITFPNGTWRTHIMQKGPEDTWFYNGTFLAPGNFTYTISAEDHSGNSQGSGPHTFNIQPGQEPKPSPEKKPRKLYIALTLLFWPLLLIIFTAAMERRYGFGNRAKKDMEPLAAALLANAPSSLNGSFDDLLKNLVRMCQKTGIPPEEYILTILTTKTPFKIRTQDLYRILMNMHEKYDGQEKVI